MTIIFDALCHLDDPRVESPLDMLERAYAAGVQNVLSAGTDPRNAPVSQELLTIPETRVHTSVGIHPSHIDRRDPDGQVAKLASRVVEERTIRAIGECGLDQRSGQPPIGIQEHVLKAQFRLASDHNLPLIVHCVTAQGRFMTFMEKNQLPPAGGFVHGYTGSKEGAMELVRHGFHISFGGMIARPDASKCRDSVVAVPADRLLVESGTPDHSPIADTPISEPAFLTQTIKIIAELRGTSPEEIAKLTADNARRLFQLAAQ
jgi:TatD DNase family protein